MNSKRTTLQHPLGIKLETPLLIPSFSSKGFAFKANDKSEVIDQLEYSREFLVDTLLVSAYDLFYKHIPWDEDNFCAEFTFIDSGGYEISEVYDLSTTSKYTYPVKEWSEKMYRQVLDQWYKHKPAVIVSYDHPNDRISLKQQIKTARKLFNDYPKMVGDFLIKPSTKTAKYVDINEIVSCINTLKSFSVVGVTEKELGNSILQRMKNISLLRESLDSSGSGAPIHVFGSLDPISSVLYFLSGAEIFDGLTWLKYSYHNNSAIYSANYGFLNSSLGIHVTDSMVRSKSVAENLYYLNTLKYAMKNYLSTRDYGVFNDSLGGEKFGEALEKSIQTLTSNKH